MAKIFEMDPEAQATWNEWVAARPENVQVMCRALPPDRLYRMKSTGHRVQLYSYCEDGTLTVIVSGKYNAVMFDRRVFGISAADLEECELPLPGERLGAALTEQKDVDKFIERARSTGALNPESN